MAFLFSLIGSFLLVLPACCGRHVASTAMRVPKESLDIKPSPLQRAAATPFGVINVVPHEGVMQVRQLDINERSMPECRVGDTVWVFLLSVPSDLDNQETQCPAWMGTTEKINDDGTVAVKIQNEDAPGAVHLGPVRNFPAKYLIRDLGAPDEESEITYEERYAFCAPHRKIILREEVMYQRHGKAFAQVRDKLGWHPRHFLTNIQLFSRDAYLHHAEKTALHYQRCEGPDACAGREETVELCDMQAALVDHGFTLKVPSSTYMKEKGDYTFIFKESKGNYEARRKWVDTIAELRAKNCK